MEGRQGRTFKSGVPLVARVRGQMSGFNLQRLVDDVARALRCNVEQVDVLEDPNLVMGRVELEVIGDLYGYCQLHRRDLDDGIESGPRARIESIEMAVAASIARIEMRGRSWTCEMRTVRSLTPQPSGLGGRPSPGGGKQRGPAMHGKPGYVGGEPSRKGAGRGAPSAHT